MRVACFCGGRMLCMSGQLEQVAEATFMVFTDLTAEETPGKRKAFFKCASFAPPMILT